MSILRSVQCAAVGAFLLLASAEAVAQISGAGSTLSRELMSRWGQAHGAKAGGVTYEAVGSSRGVEHARKAEVDFGVTDVPLTAVALGQSNLRQLPLAATAVVIAVNIPEIDKQPLRLTGDILANIYTGKITSWDHSTIRGINPSLKLPNRPIVPLWRSDGSGQSYVFSSYLSRQNVVWRRSHGTSQQLSGLSGRGVVGGAAMLAALKATPGAIGYDGFATSRAAGVTLASLRNASEQYVSPSDASITEALSKARWSFDTVENSADLDASPGADSYPISAVIYAVIPAAGANAKKTTAYLQEAVRTGDASVTSTGFLPLPTQAKTAVASK